MASGALDYIHIFGALHTLSRDNACYPLDTLLSAAADHRDCHASALLSDAREACAHLRISID